jgi:hypothetical protein
MKRTSVRLSALLIALATAGSLLGGCSSVPQVTVSRPWTRTLSGAAEIPTGASYTLVVKGKTIPLAEDERLLQAELGEHLDELLERRGFRKVATLPDITFTLHYLTDKTGQLNVYTNSTTRAASRSQSASYGVGAASYERTLTGVLGSMIAGQVSASSSSSAAATRSYAQETRNYEHSLILEAHTADGRLIWRGESILESDEVDVRDVVHAPMMQLMLSLPKNPGSNPRVREVRENRAATFYRLKGWGVRFVGPLLPYAIWFQSTWGRSSYVPSAVQDKRAFEAYVDLLRSAELVVPTGQQDYSRPTDPGLWSDVMLGGMYYIGNDSAPSKVLIRLEGSQTGYIVKRCWVATNDEYKKFEEKLAQWQSALQSYYDIYTPLSVPLRSE